MLLAGVVGVITGGVAGRVVALANAKVPFLARLTGHGVEAGIVAPVNDTFKVAVPVPFWFVAVSVIVYDPTLVGMPEITPVVVLIVNPAIGNGAGPKLSGRPFVLGARENDSPTVPDAFM